MQNLGQKIQCNLPTAEMQGTRPFFPLQAGSI